MTSLSRLARIATSVTALAMLLTLAPQPAAAQQSGGWRGLLVGLGNAFTGGSIQGSWQGGKTERDPIHGGYLNLSFGFQFSADGTYQEVALVGSMRVMTASGTYSQVGNRLTFMPTECAFTRPEYDQIVRLFPIPTDSAVSDTVSFSRLGNGVMASIKDGASGEDWGIKTGQ